MNLKYTDLKEKQRERRDSWISENEKTTGLRIHRALSWLKVSEESLNNDLGFISLWISFNALYGKKNYFNKQQLSERETFEKFFKLAVSYDHQNMISEKLWKHYTNLFRHFINNKYVFSPFWKFQDNIISEDQWKSSFESSIRLSKITLGNQDSATFLGLLFDRLYILRNQLMHGGATFDSSINRTQLKLGYTIMSELIPILIDILIDNPEENWGTPAYPPVEI